jgi:hypothetical protein
MQTESDQEMPKYGHPCRAEMNISDQDMSSDPEDSTTESMQDFYDEFAFS